MPNRRDLGWVCVAYILCVAAGAAVLFTVDWPAPWDAFAADMVATLVIFGFSRAFRNSSFYDAYWSVIPPLLAVYWMYSYPEAMESARAWLVMGLVWFWAIRLTANWTVNWPGMHHEDWRYPMVREGAGKAEMWADLGGIHVFPTIQVFLGCLPVYAVMRYGTGPLGWLDALAFVVTFGAVLIEMFSDLQLHAYLKRREPGGIINEGLWSWSRHPNYFGELAFWWGLMLFGLAVVPQYWWWIVPGALAMSAMFVFASIPMMDKRSMQRRPAYAEHMRRVSGLIPLPPRRV